MHRERFPHHFMLAIPTCITHVPWCMPGSLTSGFRWSRWRGKCSRHSRPMRNLQFYVPGKRPMVYLTVSILQICAADKFAFYSERPFIANACNLLNGFMLCFLRWNAHHFADGIFKRIFVNTNVWISTITSPKFVPKGPINIIPALDQMMACCRQGDKPISEPMVVSLLTHICITRPQWVKVFFIKFIKLRDRFEMILRPEIIHRPIVNTDHHQDLEFFILSIYG